ncbi:hypothetical protein CAEBREN_28896 [Caenorhabditis brenneri]|uniref:Uncharacterized protein n=1 Tax=Caenorhabditis brenneri TaxID=135651 RepID=G0NL11_CAEBE|nr:hypothetical protein CAEBREN_28896 [Caenorhabditis brenneri]
MYKHKLNQFQDNWLYHIYFSDIIYICAKEIIALSTGNMWLNIVNNRQTDVSYYSDDEDFEYISSDEEYEIVYKDYPAYQQPKAISL